MDGEGRIAQLDLPQTILDAGHDMKAAVRWLRAHAGQLRIDVDRIVDYQNALDLKARADAVGVHAELVPIQGGSHAAYVEYLQTYQVESVAFLYEQLRLVELAGLAARPGFAAPGTLTFDSYGLAGDSYVILAGSQSASASIPGLGTLCIGPSHDLLLAVEAALPATPRLAAEAWSVAVPAGLAGATIYWQALHLEGSEARWLTNCVATQF